MARRALQQPVAGDVLLGVFGNHLLRFVFVATIARVSGVRLHMAHRARNFAAFAMIQWKGVLRQLRRSPGGGGVASRALQAKNSGVDGRFLMTATALVGRAAECLRHMAGLTIQNRMSAVQCKDLAMVKVQHIARAIMATHTIRAILLNVLRHKVGIRAAVAINARFGG